MAYAPVILFALLATLCAAGAVGVVVSRNIVRTSVCLLSTLVGIAGIYVLLESEFLAAVQLVVYAGGTLVLIIFGVMLTTRSPVTRFTPSRGEVAVAVVVGLVLFASLLLAIRSGHFAAAPSPTAKPYTMLAMGQALLGDYLVPFELASIILLVVLIGSAYLAKARKRTERRTGGPSQRARQWS